MTQYIFNEEVIRQDKRKTYYKVFMIIGMIFFALLAALACLLPKIVYNYWPSAPGFVQKVADFLIPTGNKVIFAVLFGIIAFLFLISLITSVKARLYVTSRRLCLMKSKRNYKEARYDKIDAIKVRGHKIKVYAVGRRVFSFGPIENPLATRNCIVHMIEEPCADECGCDDAPQFGDLTDSGAAAGVSGDPSDTENN
ncbi:MAG TPA: hypothetical protein O0X39_06570 [Methanocorpusculum sp.]|nr:hypothetical protein [Methanocorpusculum sp.]